MFSKKILRRADDKSGAKMLAKDQDQLMGKLVKKLKKENPGVEITKEMVLNALEKECDKERDLRKKNQQKIRELKTNTREFERNVIDRVIQSKNTDYLQRFIEDKYKVSPFEALYIILNHDERAYIAVREIAMNSDEKKLGI